MPLRLICLSFAVAITASLVGQQAVVHVTAADHRAGRGDSVGTYTDIRRKGGEYVLRFSGKVGVREVACADIWGFTVNDVLYRIHPVERVPVRLMAQGAVCYYENGFAHLRMQRTGSELEPSGPGHRSYVGRTLEGDIVPAVFAAGDGGAAGRFRAQHPELELLCACIGADDDLHRTRQCVVDFEAMLEGDDHLRQVMRVDRKIEGMGEDTFAPCRKRPPR